MADYETFDANRVKHMEMIQATVARLAGNSFLVKGWALTLTGAFLAFAVNEDSCELAAAAFLPIVAFWALDTYYLRAERLFRVLFDQVRSEAPGIEPFFMGATGKTFVSTAPSDVASVWKTFVRLSLAGFYGLLIVATVLVVVVVSTG